MIKGIFYIFFKLPFDLFMILLKIAFLPFQLIARILGAAPKINTPTYKPRIYSQSSFDKEANLWGLSNEDKRIAKQERMSPADYIEAEERDDDNLDYDD